MKYIKCVLFIFFISSCASKSLENYYTLAETLFFKKQYKASIREFDRIAEKEPFEKIGIKSLKRKAVIEDIYLGDYLGALKSYQLLLKRLKDKNEIIKIKTNIADLYFTKIYDYLEAAKYYGLLFKENPNHSKADFYGYRLGRSLFMLSKFKDSIKVFKYIEKKYKNSLYYDKSKLAIGNILNVEGKCEKAIEVYGLISNESKQKDIVMEAKLGKANCHEELNQLDEAYKILTSIKKNYPSQEVIDLKIAKIKKRKIAKIR